jgi:hypothetical protein
MGLESVKKEDVRPGSKRDTCYIMVEGLHGRREKLISLSVEEFWKRHAKYMAGALIQEAFVRQSTDEREFLLTGMTPEEFEKVFDAFDDKVG